MAKSAGCSFRGPVFSSQYTQGGSQPSGTPVPGILIPLLASAVTVHTARAVHRHAFRQTTHTRKTTINENLKKK